MIDTNDKATQPLPLEPKRGRGRPATGKAISNADRQRAFRERQKKTADGCKNVPLNKAEMGVIISMLQDDLRERSLSAMNNKVLQEAQESSRKFMKALVEKIAKIYHED